MVSNSLFLKRAVARGADWQVAYPALSMASTIDLVDVRRKQIVVAAADETILRAVFFSSLGAVLDFQATWDELDASGKEWLAFTIRWNRWWLPNADHVRWLVRRAFAPADLNLANQRLVGDPQDTACFRRYLDVVEQHYRRDEMISRILFASEVAPELEPALNDSAGHWE